GQEQRSREPRSHIEGATPATAVWAYGYFPDPYNPRIFLDRRIPVSDLLAPDSIEGMLDQSYNLKYEIALATLEQAQGNPTAARAKQLDANLSRYRAQLATVEAALKDLDSRSRDLEARARDTEKQGKPTEAASIRQQAAALHSPPVTIEMTFNVYRTTKG